MPKTGLKRAYQLSPQEVYERFETSGDGLKPYDVEKRLETYGKNEITNRYHHPTWWIFFQQFRSALVIILVIATVISAWLGEIIDASVIFAILLLNAGLGFVQERKAEKSLEALRQLTAPKAKVIRSGQAVEIKASELVPGDILLLQTGDKIPADCRIVEQMNFRTDESSLTGESTPVEKTPEDIAISGMIVSEMKNMAFAGTTAVYGHAKAVVTATGMATEFGKIAKELSLPEERTPLQEKLDNLGKQLGIGLVCISAIIFLVGIATGLTPVFMFIVAVALAVAAIPEGLPAVITITMAGGVHRLAKKNAVVRRLGSVETLGSTTVICTDKTGTLTMNEMAVQKLYVDGKILDITGKGYDTHGEFHLDNRKVNTKNLDDVKLLLAAGMLCNDVIMAEKIIGDPTEAALYISAKKAGMDDLRNSYPRIDEITFDSTRKMMTVMNEIGSKHVVYSKGAVEEILKCCTHILRNGQISRISQDDKVKILGINQNFAKSALRVLAFAIKRGNKKMGISEHELTFVGLQAMSDTPRPEARDAIAKCKEAGIKVVMITGDHKETAMAIAKDLGMIEQDEQNTTITGTELDKLPENELRKVVDKVKVYARVSPEHKIKIVNALKSEGHIVAMTGDGINDVPALKKADIGIAMGKVGTDVARESSEITLLDDNFATIVSTIEEGRGIFDNIRKFVFYMLSANAAEVIALTAAMFIAIMLGMPSEAIVLLLPVQILWMNLVTDGLPALALGAEPTDKNVMKRSPKNPADPILTSRTTVWIVTIGCLVALFAILAYFFFMPNKPLARTMAFTMLVILEMVVALSSRSETSIARIGILSNPKLLAAITLSIILQLAVVYLPAAQTLFGTVALGYFEWLVLIISGIAVFAILELAKFIQERLFTPRKMVVKTAGWAKKME